MRIKIIYILCITMLMLCSCEKTENNAEEQTNKPDIDTTTLSSTMVYSEISNIMQDPMSYVGKTIRIKGEYLPMTSEDGSVIYPACLIADATACCQQGIEFVTSDQEYPQEGTQITIQGIFRPYTDKIDGQTYFHLEDTEYIQK